MLALQPGRTVQDLDIREARLAETGAEVRPANPGTDPLIIAVQRLPAGQHHPATGLEDPADLAVSDSGLVRELDSVGTQDGLYAGIGQSRRRELTNAEARIAHAHSRGL